MVVFGDGCGNEAGAGLIDVVDGCGRGDTTDPSPKAFRPRKLCKKKVILFVKKVEIISCCSLKFRYVLHKRKVYRQQIEL